MDRIGYKQLDKLCKFIKEARKSFTTIVSRQFIHDCEFKILKIRLDEIERIIKQKGEKNEK